MTVRQETTGGELLLVEDSPADARLTFEALRDVHSRVRIHHVEDGASALEFLRRKGPFANSPRPDLVLLDLNLPGIDGRDVLQQIKKTPALAPIPVVVLTSSMAQTDITRAYALSANCYITKPVNLVDYLSMVRLIEQFWFNAVRLPDNHHAPGISVV